MRSHSKVFPTESDRVRFAFQIDHSRLRKAHALRREDRQVTNSLNERWWGLHVGNDKRGGEEG